MTISELARLLEMDYAQLGRIERGLKNPTVSFIFDVAKELRVNPFQLLEE
jgi:transcriptional regulator with XRE-family HTH domain